MIHGINENRKELCVLITHERRFQNVDSANESEHEIHE